MYLATALSSTSLLCSFQSMFCDIHPCISILCLGAPAPSHCTPFRLDPPIICKNCFYLFFFFYRTIKILLVHSFNQLLFIYTHYLSKLFHNLSTHCITDLSLASTPHLMVSFLSVPILVTPQILRRHFVSITLTLSCVFSVKREVYVSYVTVGNTTLHTTPSSYQTKTLNITHCLHCTKRFQFFTQSHFHII